MIDIKGLSVEYDGAAILWDTTLRIPKGVLMAIVGPNGAGKSTLMKAVLKLIPRLAGEVLIDGKEEIPPNKIAYIPQRSSIDWDFPVNVLEVVLMGRYGHAGFLRRMSEEDREIALQALSRVKMHDFANRQISQLSGGQQQRVFIARAIAQNADIYFLDEPFAGIDVKSEESIFAVFKELQSEGKTLVVVHHDLNSLTKYFDHLLLLNRRVVAFGPIGEVFTPEKVTEAYRK